MELYVYDKKLRLDGPEKCERVYVLKIKVVKLYHIVGGPCPT